MENIEIKPEHRNKGLAKLLYAHIENDKKRSLVPDTRSLSPVTLHIWRKKDPSKIKRYVKIGDSYAKIDKNIFSRHYDAYRLRSRFEDFKKYVQEMKTDYGWQGNLPHTQELKKKYAPFEAYVEDDGKVEYWALYNEKEDYFKDSNVKV